MPLKPLRVLFLVFIVLTARHVLAQEYQVCTNPGAGAPAGCGACTAATPTGRIFVPPSDPACFTGPWRWTATVQARAGSLGPGGAVIGVFALDLTPGALLTQHDYGVLTTVVSRILSDGGYGSYYRRVTDRIQDLPAVISARAAQLDVKYQEIVVQAPQYSARAIEQLQSITNEEKERQQSRAVAIEGQLAAVDAARAKLKTEPSPYLQSEQQLLSDARVLAAMPEAAATIPPSQLRPTGIALLGSLDGPRAAAYGTETGDLQVAIRREAYKATAVADADTRRFCEHRLRLAKKFADANTRESRIMAQYLLDESAGARFKRDGPVQDTIVYTVRDGIVVPGLARDAAGPNEIGEVAEQFEVRLAATKGAYERASSVMPPADRGEIKRLSLRSADEFLSKAASTFFGGDFATGETILNVAAGLIGLAIDFTPPLALARAAVELVVGYDIVTGGPLSALQLAFNGRVIASAGLEGGPRRIIENVKRGGKVFQEEEARVRAAEAAAKTHRSDADQAPSRSYGAVEQFCQTSTWSNCGVAVKNALQSNPSDPKEILLLVGAWDGGYDQQYQALRKAGRLEKSTPDAAKVYEEVKSHLVGLAVDPAVDGLAKQYLPRIATLLEWAQTPLKEPLKAFFDSSEIASDRDQLDLMNDDLQRRIAVLLAPSLVSDWKHRLEQATTDAVPALKPGPGLRLP